MNKIVTFINKVSSKVPYIGRYLTEEFIRFAFIGGSSFIIFYILNNAFILVLEEIIESDTDFMRGFIVWNSYILAYLLAFIYNFTLSKNWTFKNKDNNYKSQVSKFFAVNAFNAFGGAAFVTILDYAGVPPYVSQIFFVGMQTIWTYILYKKWVFKERNDLHSELAI